MLLTAQYIVISVNLYSCISFKKTERRKELMYIYSIYYINLIHHLWFSLRFELPSSIIALFQYSFAPTNLLCAIIGKYITFLYVIDLLLYMLFYIIAF